MRTDNGGEFLSHEYESILIDNKIKHETSAPYYTHQNRTVERAWRTLFDMARCLLIDAKLPKTFWTLQSWQLYILDIDAFYNEQSKHHIFWWQGDN